MDRLKFLEIEMEKLREKITSVDELRHRLNNLESWITANIGMNSKSIYRGLVLPQPPSPVKSEVKTQLPSCLIINRLSTTSSGTSVEPSSLPGDKRFDVDKSKSLPTKTTSDSTFPEAEISSTEVIPAPLASAEQIVQESSSSLPSVSSSNAEGAEESTGTGTGRESKKNKKDFRCSECNAHCSNAITYTKHKVKHNKAFHCRLCPKKFVESWHLMQHIQDVHPNASLPAFKNKTPIVGQKKSRNEKGVHSSQIQSQLRAVSGVPNYFNRRHSTGSSGLTFQGIHAKQMIYSSPQSDQNKSNSVNISSRTPVVASGSRNFQRSYSCGICGKSFPNAQNLREHVINHQPPALIAPVSGQPSHQ